MKSGLRLFLSVVALALVLASCAQATPTPAPAATPAPTPAKVYELKLQHYTALGQQPSVVVTQRWAELVKERTNGAVDIQIHALNALVPILEQHDAASRGLIDMYNWPMAYVARLSPAHGGWPTMMGVTDPPMKATDLVKVMDGGAEELMRQRFLKDNVVLFPVYQWPVYLGFYMKETVANKPGTLTGKKVRAPAGYFAEVIKALGGTPVPIALGEVYLAIQMGTVEGVFTGVTGSGFALKFYEVAPVTTASQNHYGSVYFYNAINKQVWDGIPQDLQKVMWDAALELRDWATEYSLETEQDVLKRFQDMGKPVHLLTPQEELELAKTVRPAMWAYWDKTAGEEKAALEGIFAKLGHRRP